MITKLVEGIYEVGVSDFDIRNFHGCATYKGSSYNAYLIIDEKITLIDTVKANFADRLIDNISSIVPPERIDYIISNHVEMDHSGSLPRVMAAAPNAAVITSAPNGLKGLCAHYGMSPRFKPVNAGDEISLGKRSLKFIPTPMLHWPDSMVTYCPQEKILFSNDAFGQHFASNLKFDFQNDLSEVMAEALKYYANIVMPYGQQVRKAIETLKPFDIEIIAPAHGVIWKEHIADILEKYVCFSNDIPDKKAVVVYDSMWHSTEKIADAVCRGFTENGIETRVYNLNVNHISDVMAQVLKAEYIAVGSPTLNNNMMPQVSAFLTYMKGLAPKNKKAFAFGSYGWGGQSVGLVNDALADCGFEIVSEPIKVNYIPSKEQLDEIVENVKMISR